MILRCLSKERQEQKNDDRDILLPKRAHAESISLYIPTFNTPCLVDLAPSFGVRHDTSQMSRDVHWEPDAQIMLFSKGYSMILWYFSLKDDISAT